MASSSLIKFLDTRSSNPEINPVLDRLKEIVRVLNAKQLLDGQLLETIVLTTGSIQKVPHKLTRAVNGYIVVKRSVDCRVWDSESTNLEKSTFLYLNTSATVTVSLWVF